MKLTETDRNFPVQAPVTKLCVSERKQTKCKLTLPADVAQRETTAGEEKTERERADEESILSTCSTFCRESAPMTFSINWNQRRVFEILPSACVSGRLRPAQVSLLWINIDSNMSLNVSLAIFIKSQVTVLLRTSLFT